MTSIRQAVENFYRVTEQYAEFGASDTEPRAQFALLLERLYYDEPGNPPVVPTTIRGWQLFSGMKGAGQAAKALTAAAREVVKFGKADRNGLRAVLAELWPYAYADQ